MINLEKRSWLQKGFTMIELMIATTVFTVVLLLATFALLQIGKIFSKGVNSSSTQNVARSIVDEVSQAIQFSGGTVGSPTPDGGNIYHFNAGEKCYTYILGKQLTTGSMTADQSKQVFTRNISDCNAPIDWTGSGFTELVNQKMRVAAFYLCAPGDPRSSTCLTPTPDSSNLYSVGIRVVYGDIDLLCSPAKNDCNSATTIPTSELSAPDLSCKVLAGSQYCAVAQLNTTVQARM